MRMNKKIMIVPIARISDGKRVETRFASDGDLYCLNAIEGIPLKQFDNIYFVLTQKCVDVYDLHIKTIEKCICRFAERRGANIELIVLQNETETQADTIVSALMQLQIFENATIFCKDGDSFFNINNENICENGLMIYNTEDCDMIDPKHKSYVSVDMNNIVTNTIEKTVISKYFNCGGYVFSDVHDFIRTYEELFVKYKKSPRMSNIIQYLILYKNKTFNAYICDNYKDFSIN